MNAITGIQNELLKGNYKALARAISLIENESSGYWELLKNLRPKTCRVIGITGPPGAGKSTLMNGILNVLRNNGKKIGVIAVDPSSAFSHGSVLGDRIRMSGHFLDNNVFIRSLSSRSALGGLSIKTQEVCDLMQSFGFDYLFIETVGVGQSEIEIAGIADIVILVLVPESGDEIQNMKSGIIEIGDFYVINKADRPGADKLVKSINNLILERKSKSEVIKTIAISGNGIEELIARLDHFPHISYPERDFNKIKLKILALIQHLKMKSLDLNEFDSHLKLKLKNADFNLYHFVDSYL